MALQNTLHRPRPTPSQPLSETNGIANTDAVPRAARARARPRDASRRPEWPPPPSSCTRLCVSHTRAFRRTRAYFSRANARLIASRWRAFSIVSRVAPRARRPGRSAAARSSSRSRSARRPRTPPRPPPPATRRPGTMSQLRGVRVRIQGTFGVFESGSRDWVYVALESGRRSVFWGAGVIFKSTLERCDTSRIGL